jgi:hypothetical protein
MADAGGTACVGRGARVVHEPTVLAEGRKQLDWLAARAARSSHATKGLRPERRRRARRHTSTRAYTRTRRAHYTGGRDCSRGDVGGGADLIPLDTPRYRVHTSLFSSIYSVRSLQRQV